MRIALMPSAYAPAVGGVEVLTARLAKNLTLKGHEVEVWAPRSAGDALPERERLDNVTVRRFVFAMPRASAGALVKLPPEMLRTRRALMAAVAQFRPTHLHVQCFSANGAYATALSRLTGIPLVVTLQGETVMDDRDIYDHSSTLRLALRAGLIQASAVTGCSAFTLGDANRRFGLRKRSSQVIFNGVDDAETPPIAVPIPFERYIVGLGRVVHKKGFDLLLKAFAQIADADPGLGLVIGGDGTQLEALRNQASLLGLADRVHFPGRLGRGEVAGLLDRAEIFVMPSRVEPFGIVALEGWRAGIPVVVSNRGGAGEFVEDGVSGFSVDPADTAVLAGALRHLAQSAELRETMAQNGWKRLPEFFWPEITDQYLDVYRAVDRSADTVTSAGPRRSPLDLLPSA